MDHYALLRRHIEEISPLTDEEWECVAARFSQQHRKKYQFLVQQGYPVIQEFWIVKGLVKAYCVDKSGKDHILQFATEEYWVSDHCAFQQQAPATLYVDCLENSAFLCLTLEDREAMCNTIPAMANFFRIKTHYGYLNLQRRILSLLTETAEERYNTLLAQRPNLTQRVPKKLLAAFLGVSRETLSRLRA